jgi:hypothetical protein
MTRCDAAVRRIVRERPSLLVSELITLAGHPEAEVRAVLRDMECQGEGRLSRDGLRRKETFTVSPVGLGKKAVERRVRNQADRLGVQLDRIEWTATGEDGEQVYALAVTSQGVKRACIFTQAELEACARDRENKDALKSRWSSLVRQSSDPPRAGTGRRTAARPTPGAPPRRRRTRAR